MGDLSYKAVRRKTGSTVSQDVKKILEEEKEKRKKTNCCVCIPCDRSVPKSSISVEEYIPGAAATTQKENTLQMLK